MTGLLSVRDLSVSFATDDGVVRALRDVSFDVRPGELVHLAGTNGAGKSTLMAIVAGLTLRAARDRRQDVRRARASSGASMVGWAALVVLIGIASGPRAIGTELRRHAVFERCRSSPRRDDSQSCALLEHKPMGG